MKIESSTLKYHGGFMKPFTKKQKEVLDKYLKDIEDAEEVYRSTLSMIEQNISNELDIDVEIYYTDSGFAGFGDYGRKYKLYQPRGI